MNTPEWLFSLIGATYGTLSLSLSLLARCKLLMLDASLDAMYVSDENRKLTVVKTSLAQLVILVITVTSEISMKK